MSDIRYEVEVFALYWPLFTIAAGCVLVAISEGIRHG